MWHFAIFYVIFSQIGSKLDVIGLNVDGDHLFIVFPWDKAELETGTPPSS